jgi:opacity protein-like surface antigen
MYRNLVVMAALAAVVASNVAPAHGADMLLPKMPVKALAPPVTNWSGFYVGLHGGAAVANQQYNFITQLGTSASVGGVLPGKLYPAGIPVGATLGFGGSLGGLYAGVEADFDYDFTASSGPCAWPVMGAVTVSTVCGTKNSWLMDQAIVLGIPFASITGAAAGKTVPGLVQPSQWPIPIALPSSITASNIMPFVKAGVAERNVSAFVDPVNVGKTAFAGGSSTETLIGFLVGGGLKIPLATGWTAKAEYDYIGFNKSFVPATNAPTLASPIFNSATFKQTNEQRLVMGLDYSF